MENTLYIIAVIMVVIWAIGFFAYNVGGLLHILLIIAIVSILYNILRKGHHHPV